MERGGREPKPIGPKPTPLQHNHLQNSFIYYCQTTPVMLRNTTSLSWHTNSTPKGKTTLDTVLFSLSTHLVRVSACRCTHTHRYTYIDTYDTYSDTQICIQQYIYTCSLTQATHIHIDSIHTKIHRQHVHIQTHTHTHSYATLSPHMHTHSHTHTHTHTHSMCTFTNTHKHTHRYIHLYLYTHRCMFLYKLCMVY